MEKLEVSWIEENNIRELKNRVMDEDYNTELHVHYGFLYEQVQSLKHREHDL